MTFVLPYLAAMVLPGAVLVWVLRLGANRFGASVAFSVSILLVSLAVARSLEIGAGGFGVLLVAVYAALCAAGVWRLRSAGLPDFGGCWGDRTYLIPAGTIALVGIYALWAGPYTEVPADAWWHLGRINGQLHQLSDGHIGLLTSAIHLFDKSEGYSYTITAYFVHLAGLTLQGALEPIAFANTLLFAAGIYSFALFIFRTSIPDRRILHAVSAASVFFFFTHFGLSVFSYVRYYVYGPTILNYVVYLTGLAYFLTFIDAKNGKYKYLAFAVLLGVVTLMMHKQEGLFLATMIGAILLVRVVADGYRLWHGRGEGARRAALAGNERSYVLFMAAGLAYLALHVTAYVTLRRHDPLQHGLMSDINAYIPFLRNLYILNPTYQFYQVITVWGVLVYMLFAARFKLFAGNSYIVAGMILPLLTVFNPVYTDLFLRFSKPLVLWRLCYALPLPFVGGRLLVRSLRMSVGGRGLAGRAAGVVGGAAMIALLFPVNTTFFVSPYSRIYTLEPVRRTNDYRLWKDMIAYLDTRKAGHVITDPVTGYVLNGLTTQRYSGYKFYGFGALPVGRNHYGKADFVDRNGWLVIINQRDGAPSDTGRIGRHWPGDIMEVSHWYSDAFKKYISDNPRRFKRIWAADGIRIYRIRAL